MRLDVYMITFILTLVEANSRRHHFSSARQESSSPGLWTTWSRWTGCSMSSRQGTRSRYRGCVQRSRSGLVRLDDSRCSENPREYEICEDDPCAAVTDPREYQCAQHNEDDILEQQYDWIPFFGGPSPCELTCLARGYAFYNSFGKVTDGTPCWNTDTGQADEEYQENVCINGTCQAVACDGSVGSGTVPDKCLVCGGENRDCLRYRNSYLQLDPPTQPHQQYQMMVHIPAGSTYVEVTDHSGNYLALADDIGTYILNGNWMIEWPGEYEVSGTIINYKRTGLTEILTIDGPTTRNITLMLLFTVRNPGVHYEFYIPNNKSSQITLPEPRFRVKQEPTYIPPVFRPPIYGEENPTFETTDFDIERQRQENQKTQPDKADDKKQRQYVPKPKRYSGIEIPLAKPYYAPGEEPVEDEKEVEETTVKPTTAATTSPQLSSDLPWYLQAQRSEAFENFGEQGIPLVSPNNPQPNQNVYQVGGVPYPHSQPNGAGQFPGASNWGRNGGNNPLNYGPSGNPNAQPSNLNWNQQQNYQFYPPNDQRFQGQRSRNLPVDQQPQDGSNLFQNYNYQNYNPGYPNFGNAPYPNGQNVPNPGFPGGSRQHVPPPNNPYGIGADTGIYQQPLHSKDQVPIQDPNQQILPSDSGLFNHQPDPSRYLSEEEREFLRVNQEYLLQGEGGSLDLSGRKIVSLYKPSPNPVAELPTPSRTVQVSAERKHKDFTSDSGTNIPNHRQAVPYDNRPAPNDRNFNRGINAHEQRQTLPEENRQYFNPYPSRELQEHHRELSSPTISTQKLNLYQNVPDDTSKTSNSNPESSDRTHRRLSSNLVHSASERDSLSQNPDFSDRNRNRATSHSQTRPRGSTQRGYALSRDRKDYLEYYREVSSHDKDNPSYQPSFPGHASYIDTQTYYNNYQEQKARTPVQLYNDDSEVSQSEDESASNGKVNNDFNLYDVFGLPQKDEDGYYELVDLTWLNNDGKTNADQQNEPLGTNERTNEIIETTENRDLTEERPVKSRTDIMPSEHKKVVHERGKLHSGKFNAVHKKESPLETRRHIAHEQNSVSNEEKESDFGDVSTVSADVTNDSFPSKEQNAAAPPSPAITIATTTFGEMKSSKCPRCSKVKNMKENYCKSDFVGRISILTSRGVGNATRYAIDIQEVYRQTSDYFNPGELWLSSRCPCPRLKRGREYIIMAQLVDGRSVIDNSSFVRKYKKSIESKLMKTALKCPTT